MVQRSLFIALAFFSFVASSLAAPARKVVPQPAPEAPALTDPPYQSRLDRLAEILGGLHHLRPLCDPAEGQKWRTAMLALMDAETPGPDRRDRMIDQFNRNYSGFRETYQACTPSARLAADRYRDEAIKLSRDLTSRFTD